MCSSSYWLHPVGLAFAAAHVYCVILETFGVSLEDSIVPSNRTQGALACSPRADAKTLILGRRSVGPACKVSDFIPRDYSLCKLPVTKLTAVRTPGEIIASVEDQLPPATVGNVESQLLNGLGSLDDGPPEIPHQLQVRLRIVPYGVYHGCSRLLFTSIR